MTSIAPYGSWDSPITTTMLSRSGIGLGEVVADGGDLYWLESRPTESGRSVIVRRKPDGTIEDINPPGFNSRTRAHEYGGGAYAVREGVIISSHFEDQRAYRLDGAEPLPITPEPDVPAADRYADYVLLGDVVICVRERHRPDSEAANELITFPVDGSAPPRVIAGGRDFVSSPAASPDGTRLAWLTWDHPNMPWDGTELWVADLGRDGSIREPRRLAGGPDESIFQPGWSPDGRLHFVSDRTGWWNLYRLEEPGGTTALCPMEAEFGAPLWQFGYRRYGFLPDGTAVAVFESNGTGRVGLLTDGGLEILPIARDQIDPTLAIGAGRIWTVAASPALPAAVIGLDPATGAEQLVRPSISLDLDGGFVSRPRAITFPTTHDAVAHAFYYPPANAGFAPPPGELPPLVVWSHGGPTGSTSSGFSLGRQFWTSRGFALVDVNYRGSTGYGRAFRNALRGQWGVFDTDDCIAAARYLAGQGLVDGDRMAIRGGSAGGFTTLCALTFHDEFATGASYFGVADITALARDTHKFESRYLDSMVGPYPEAAELYRERSPVFHTDRLSRPMVILQGLDDEVVLPNQAEMMVDALERKNIPYAYLAFEGEGHGFRRAENIDRAAQAELSFYGWVFGFEPAGDLQPVEIHGL